MLITFAVFMLGLLVGILGGVWAARRLLPPEPPREAIARFMASAVNREEAEEQRHLNRLALLRGGRRTMRTDGGPSAKVHRMRKRHNKIHIPE